MTATDLQGLDERIAVEVFRWILNGPSVPTRYWSRPLANGRLAFESWTRPWSRRIETAWEVVEEMQRLDYEYMLRSHPDKDTHTARFRTRGPAGMGCWGDGRTPAEAICRAALAVVEARKAEG